MMQSSLRNQMWYEFANKLFYGIKSFFLVFIVVVWCDLLGDIQWREDPLPRSSSYGLASSAGQGSACGKTSQRSMH